MSATLEPGLTHQLTRQVAAEMTAARLGSGGVEVLGTPFMISLMELASWLAVQEYLARFLERVAARRTR